MRQRPNGERRGTAALTAGLLLLGLGSSACDVTGLTNRVQAAFGHRSASPTQLLDAARPAVVTLGVSLYRGRTVEGSGFVVDRDGSVVTSASLIKRGAIAVTVTDGYGTRGDASVLGTDASIGIAVLRAPSLTGRSRLTLGSQRIQSGASVLAPGNPALVRPDPATASVRAVNRSATVGGRRLTGLMEVATTAVPASTGSPVLDMQGGVAGVLVVGDPPAHHVYATPVAPVVRQLAAWAGRRWPIPLQPALVSANATTLLLQTDDVPAGFEVSSVSTIPGTGVEGKETIYHLAATETHPAQALATFAVVLPSVTSAQDEYASLSAYNGAYGYVRAATPELGDEAVLRIKHESSSLGPSTVDRFQVTWRDRNVVAWLELAIRAGDRTADDALHLAALQQARIAADLTAY
jgi:putative serine protease PepD